MKQVTQAISKVSKVALFNILIALPLLVMTSYAFAFSVSTDKQTYSIGESIQVAYNGFATETDWVTIVRSSAATDSYAEWYYTQGNQSGSLTFKPLQEGTYEVRAYCCWQPGRPGHGGYNVRARKTINVVAGGGSGGNSSGRVCRDLRPGDPYYSGWVSCCDIGNGKSNWKKRSTGQVTPYDGTCNSWGIK